MNLQKKSSKEFRSTFSDSSLKYEQAGYAYALLEFQCSPIKGLILRLLIEGKIDPAKEKALQNRYVRERVSQFCSKSKKGIGRKVSGQPKTFRLAVWMLRMKCTSKLIQILEARNM